MATIFCLANCVKNWIICVEIFTRQNYHCQMAWVRHWLKIIFFLPENISPWQVKPHCLALLSAVSTVTVSLAQSWDAIHRATGPHLNKNNGFIKQQWLARGHIYIFIGLTFRETSVWKPPLSLFGNWEVIGSNLMEKPQCGSHHSACSVTGRLLGQIKWRNRSVEATTQLVPCNNIAGFFLLFNPGRDFMFILRWKVSSMFSTQQNHHATYL